MVNGIDFIHLIISVLFTGTQKEKTEAYCSLKVCSVGRDGGEGSGSLGRRTGHQSHTGTAMSPEGKPVLSYCSDMDRLPPLT